jgi:hypothetical protein
MYNILILFNSICRQKLLGVTVDFDVTDHLRTRLFTRQIMKGSVMGQYSNYLQISRRPVTQPEEKYGILIECGVPVKLVSLTKMCLKDTYSKVLTEKICLIHFLFRIVRHKEMVYRHGFPTWL